MAEARVPKRGQQSKGDNQEATGGGETAEAKIRRILGDQSSREMKGEYGNFSASDELDKLEKLVVLAEGSFFYAIGLDPGDDPTPMQNGFYFFLGEIGRRLIEITDKIVQQEDTWRETPTEQLYRAKSKLKRCSEGGCANPIENLDSIVQIIESASVALRQKLREAEELMFVADNFAAYFSMALSKRAEGRHHD